MLGETRDALYVAFMGTKQRRDIVSNAKIEMAPLWPSDFPPNEVLDSPECYYAECLLQLQTTSMAMAQSNPVIPSAASTASDIMLSCGGRRVRRCTEVSCIARGLWTSMLCTGMPRRRGCAWSCAVRSMAPQLRVANWKDLLSTSLHAGPALWDHVIIHGTSADSALCFYVAQDIPWGVQWHRSARSIS